MGDGIAIIKGEKTPAKLVSAPDEGSDKQANTDEQLNTDEQKDSEPMANGSDTVQEEPQGVHSFSRSCARGFTGPILWALLLRSQVRIRSRLGWP